MAIRPQGMTLLAGVLAATLVALTGCAAQGGPYARTPGADLPLELESRATRERLIEVEVADGTGHRPLVHQEYRIAPGAWGRIEPVRVPYGSYQLTATSGDLARHVDAEFGPGDEFFRFVLYDDVVAFQRG